MSPKCRMPNCKKEARGRGPNVDGFGAKFCSPACELKFDHVRSDARDARRAAEAQTKDPAISGGRY